MFSLALLGLALLAAVAPSDAKFLTAADIAGKSYDYVVVGAGTAGNVIANRLTENSNMRVLVIEAGVSNEGVLEVAVPALCVSATPNTPWTWNYSTTPQSALNNRVLPLPRGRILGGTSSLNYMVYTRGGSDDFDRYARIAGDSGWSWNSILPYIKKAEKWVQPADNHDTTGEYTPAVHGTSGPLGVSLPGFPSPIDQKVLQTLAEQHAEFPYNIDMNSGNTIGVGWLQSTIRAGLHISSAVAYLTPSVLARPNLDIVLQTQVTKLIKTGTRNGLPLFGAVQFTTGRGAPVFKVSASREVILSAGSINTPQLLLLSGIGDPKALAAKGITPLVDLPAVGQNLSDHPFLPTQWYVNSNSTLDMFSRNATLAAEALEQWNVTRTGPFVDSPANHLGWLRLPNDASIFKTHKDPSAGLTSGHYEAVFVNGFSSFSGPAPATGNYFTILTAASSPASRGSVTLSSGDPFDAPLVDPAYVTDPFDLFVLVESVKAAFRFAAGAAWKDHIIRPYESAANLVTDADYTRYVQQYTTSEWHPSGTAGMSPKGAAFGVVDPDLTVKKAVGLRIVDASVLPIVPAAHPQAAVYAFAERAADLIKQHHALASNSLFSLEAVHNEVKFST